MDFWSKVIWCCFITSFFSVLLTRTALAVTIASQENNYSANLDVWQAMQELGANLSGKLQSFTFRVRTERSNLNQFDNTALNTRIYDKSNNNSYVYSCVPSGNDKLLGLTFNTSGVPQGYEDVTIDFSCRNYQFIPGHKYLIVIANANMGNSGTGIMLFAAASYLGTNEDLFPDGGLRYGNGNRYDYGNNVGICDPVAYNWGSTNPYRNGCYVWGNPKNDLYFVLRNNAPPPPPPRLPVVFIPGIGGSEFKASQDIFWSDKDNGHGGKFSYAYKLDEKIWVNQEKAVEFGDDDYFDVLRLKPDGQTPEAALSLTGNLTSFGYGEIDSFFTGMGYEKGKNFFVFPYDWRKDVRTTKDDLDNLIEQARQKSGQIKVNLVVHSLGGLIARYYISDSTKAGKVNKLIELGVPHLGTVYALKTLMYGFSLQKNVFGIFPIGIPANEIRDIGQNNPGLFQLLPSLQYFSFYTNSVDIPYPYRDDRDIDSNKIIGPLEYNQTINLLSNLSYNMIAFDFGEQLHSTLDPVLNQTNGVKVYEIVGTAQPTLGQIQETWWVTWPVNLIPKTEEIYINGDDTVPLYSASLKSDSQDISGATKIWYVEQKHSDLVSSNGTAMQTVKSILNDDNTIPVEVKSLKIDLEGEQLSLDDGELELYDDEGKHTGIKDNSEIEENIPDTFYTTSGKTKHAFVKKKAKKIKIKVTRKNLKSQDPKTTNIKIRTYKKDKISKTTIYKSLPLTQISKLEFNLDPNLDTSPILAFFPDETKPDSLNITPTSEVSGDSSSDQTAPKTSVQISGTKDSSGIYSSPVTVTLSGNDDSSGILKIEYSLDNGSTVQTYTNPFIISAPGKTTIQVKSIDKLGNEEIPQTISVEIAASPTPTPTPTPSSINNTSNGTATSITPGESKPTPGVNSANTSSQASLAHLPNKPTSQESKPTWEVLASHLEGEPRTSEVLGINSDEIKKQNNPVKQVLSGLLIISAGITALASLGFALTFIHPAPK